MPILLELPYLPNVQFFTKFLQEGAVVLEQHEHYLKGSYRNRCHLAGSHGLLRLSVPLRKGKHEQLPIREVRIAYDEPWPHQHAETIRSAYGRSPYFEFYGPELLDFYQRPYDLLFDLNLDLLQFLLRALQIEWTPRFTDAYQPSPPAGWTDLRDAIHPKAHRQVKDPRFRAAKYPQVFAEKHGFLPNLSVIDLLFCAGPQARLVLAECIT